MAKPSIFKKSSASSIKHPKPAAGSGGDGKPTKINNSHQKVLNRAAAMTIEDGEPEISREDLASATGLVIRSLANVLKPLKDAGLVVLTPKTVTVTPKGMDLADTKNVESSAPKSNEEHQERMKNRTGRKLNKKECELVDQLADGLTRNKEVVAKAMGYTNIRSFSNLLTNPKKHGVIEAEGKGIRLTDKMFLPKLGRPCDKN
jgi:predicted methyltransferase